MRTCRNSPFVWMVLNGEDLVPTYNPFLCRVFFSLYHGFVEKGPLSHEMQYFERHTNLWAFQNWAWQSSKNHGQTASFSGWDKYPSAGYVEWWPLGLIYLGSLLTRSTVWFGRLWCTVGICVEHLVKLVFFCISQVTRYLWWLCSTKFLQAIGTFVHWFQGWIVVSIKNWTSKSLSLCINYPETNKSHLKPRGLVQMSFLLGAVIFSGANC